MKRTPEVDPQYYTTKLNEIIRDLDKFAIIAALETYKSINLSQLSLILQKPRTTLLGHVKILLEDQIVEVDSETSSKNWGKFYKLTRTFKQEFTKHRPSLYSSYTKVQDEIIEDISANQIKDIILRRKKFRDETGLSLERLTQYCGFAFFIQKFIFNNIAEMDKLDENSTIFTETDLMNAYHILFSRGFRVSKPTHIMKFTSLIRKFLAEFLALSEEIEKEIEQKNIAEEDIKRYFLHVFGGTL
ncbi:MAG: hypothetical protein HGN29_16955 [Asgard group archaeon]|nr:hypothetical protein [Asgard group archaeon]